MICLVLGVAPSRANEQHGSGEWLLGFELQQRNFDTMSAGDSRPTTRADAGLRGSIDWLLAPRWALGFSYSFGGTWFDWSDPVYNTAGKLEDTAWDVRCGLDRVIALGAHGMVFVGAGVEYGEAHSWVHTLGTAPGSPGSQNIDAEGPRCYWTGGYARVVAITPTWRRMALSAQISESFYGAHASDQRFGTQYNWFGRSLGVSAGLRFKLTGPSAKGP